MGRKKKTKKVESLSLDPEDRSLVLWFRLIDLFQNCFKIFVVGACFCVFVIYGIWKPIESSAGKETSINYAVNLISSLGMNGWVSWGAAASCGLFAYRERKLRIKERDQKDSRLAKYEQSLDPERTSSGLTVAGESEAKEEQ